MSVDLINDEKLNAFPEFFYTIGVLPASYKISLTYQEQLEEIMKFLRDQIIPKFNNNAAALGELQTKFQELVVYVDDYFNNLDITEEVSNKLNEMAEDGTLTELIKNYVDPFIEEQNNTIEEINERTISQNNEINQRLSQQDDKINLISNINPIPVASIDNMTDTSKIYVNTTNGYWYYYNTDNEEWTQGGLYQSTSDHEDLEKIKEALGLYLYGFSATSTALYFNYNIPNSEVSSGDNIYIKLLDFSGGVIRNYAIYGYPETGSGTLIKTFSGDDIEKVNKITMNNNYHHIRVVVNFSELITNYKTAHIIFGINNNSIINELADIENEIINIETNTNNINEIKDIIGLGLQSFSASSGQSFMYRNIPNSEVTINQEMYFKFLSLKNATVRNISIYGYPEESGSGILLKTITNDINKSIKIKFNDNYDHIRVVINFNETSSSNTQASFIYGLSNQSIISELADIESKIDNLDTTFNLNKTTLKIFKKVVCCGDSYTSGYIVDIPNNTPHEVNEDYAFPHYLETLTGNTYINCGASGASSKTWLTNARGLAKAQASGRAQAYIVGLMINDSSDTTRHVDLGSTDDIGTNADTYYAYYSKIIRELNIISPTAKIFIETCPNIDVERYDPYNQAVRDIYEEYKNIYPVHLLDLAEYKNLFTNHSLTDDLYLGHYSALGYEQFAEILNYIISDYINNHVTDFKDVAFIPYD